MAGSVAAVDKGWERIKHEAKALEGRGVRVGLRAGGASGEVVQYAAHNEFGTERIPSRPWMRRTADNGKAAVAAQMGALARGVVDGRLGAEAALDRLGLWYVNELQKSIQSSPGWAAPLSPATVARKGSSVPLIDTRAMLRSVDHEKD